MDTWVVVLIVVVVVVVVLGVVLGVVRARSSAAASTRMGLPPIGSLSGEEPPRPAGPAPSTGDAGTAAPDETAGRRSSPSRPEQGHVAD